MTVPADHICRAWCGDEHVDLAYWEDHAWSPEEVRRAWQRKGMRVTRIEPATEAPAATGARQGTPHLVWFQ